MLERFERPIKIVCLGLAALLMWQLSNVFLTVDPLKNLNIPEVPTLAEETNSASKTDVKPAKPAKVAKAGTNEPAGTNISKATNAAPETNAVKTTNSPTGTNVVTGTNTTHTNIAKASTNSPAPPAAQPEAGPPPGMPPEVFASLPPEVRAQIAGGGGGMFPGGGRGGGRGGKKIELPKDLKARVDRIINSELLGQLPHPMPLQLLGIAEDTAFIQATNGQSGPVKIGGEMGGVKLLRIGFNRVLIETGGQTNELQLFGGIGGESLMPHPAPEPPKTPSTTNSSTNSISISK